ncbi:CG12662 [Drosophila busckii]|uniref:CG12662 n=2 Tax=Drosophila busckii TaxID=30019 RepID=A0A0M4EK31_DROBS|nr:CG12662 [Drosophila busckii]
MWDTPDYGLELKMFPSNNSMSSLTFVRKDVPIPMWNLLLLQHPVKRHNKLRTERPRVLYNSSVRTCEFWKYVRRFGAWNNAAKQMLSTGGSNLSLDCPLKKGVYSLNVITIPPDTAFLKFMYHPNTIFSIHGTVYSVNPKNTSSKQPICHYEINTTVVKTC